MFKSLSHEQKRTLDIISIIEFSRMLGIFLVIPVIALFAERFTTSGYVIGIAVASYEVSMALFQIPMGKLSDRIGRKNAIIIGLIPFIFGNILSFYCDNITLLIISRFIAGAGAISSPAIAWAQEIVDPRQKGISMSYVGGAIGISFLLGTSFSPEISSVLGIRSVFLISVIVGVFSLMILMFSNHTVQFKERIASTGKEHSIRIRIIPLIFISFLVSTSAFIFFYLLQIYSVANYELSGYSYMLFIPVIIGGVVAIYFSEDARRKKKILPKEISYPIMGIGLLLLSSIAFVNISAIELSILLIPYFIGYSVYELLMIPFLTGTLRSEDYGVGIGIFYSFQFIGSAIGAISGGILIGNNATSIMIQISLAICLLSILASFLISSRYANHPKASAGSPQYEE